MPTRDFYVTQQLGETRYRTPEGYLVAVGVPITRTGTFTYREHETTVKAGPDGLVHTRRDAADVFAPSALASFVGKPITLNHPTQDVTPANWHQLAVGTVQNVRRGEAGQDHLMLADLLITRQDAIDAVLGGLREVSCGYDVEYVQDSPGQARHTNIIGNHVALVAQGRAGPICAVGDTVMPKTKFVDRVRAAFHSRDAAGLERELRVVDEEEGGAGGADLPTQDPIDVGTDTPTLGGEQDLVINIDPPAAFPEGGGMDRIMDSLDRFDRRLTAIETKLSSTQPARTGDAASPLSADLLGRIEILAPSLKTITLDAGATHPEAAAQRQALAASPQGQELLRGRAVDSLSDAQVEATFDAAVVLATGANNRAYGARPSGPAARPGGSGEDVRPLTPAEINKRNRETWKQKGVR